jgi:large subunit ribosomal protein L18
MQGNVLKLSLGYSHEVNFDVPQGVTISTPKQTEIVVEGSTSSWSARSPRTSASGARPSPTRARASATRASTSSARKARRSKGRNNGEHETGSVPQAPPARPEQAAEVNDGRARLSVHRSNKNISVQLIDDVKGVTLAAASTLEKDLGVVGKNNVEAAAKVGAASPSGPRQAGVEDLLFRPRRFPLSRKVKALADAAREGGLKF